MITTEEVLGKLLEYSLRNTLPTYLTEVKLEWDSPHTIGTVTLPADPIMNFPSSMPQIVFSGWEEIDKIERFDRFPCAFVFITDVTPLAEIVFEQETADRVSLACGIRVIDQGTDEVVLEKKLYRMTDAVYRMVRHDMYLSGSGYAVMEVSKAYSAVAPYQNILFKAGQVSFMVVVSDVT